MKSVVLCADETSLSHPEYVGLEGESLASQAWLRTFSNAQEARSALMRAKEVAEVWVVSNDEVEPINLAATLKRDRPDRVVYLVSSEPSGSLLSRANLAMLDGVMSKAEFVARYTRWKRDDLRQATLSAPIAPPMITVSSSSRGESSLLGKEGEAVRKGGQATEESFGRHAAEVVVKRAYPSAQETAPLSPRLPKHAVAESKPVQVVSVAKVDGGAETPSSSVSSPIRPDAAEYLEPASVIVPPKTSLGLSKQAFLLPVISASGGSGKSAIAALAAMLTHRAGLKTLLLDLDLQFGDMRELVGCEKAMTVDELLAAPVRIEQVASEGDAPALLCAPRNLEASEDVVAHLPELLDLVCSRFDVVIANTGGFWTDEHIVLLERCSRALFVIDQRPSSLRACQRALDLCAKCGIAVSPLVFAVNKCSRQGLYTSIDVSCALHGACSKELYWGGTQVEEMLAAGRAAELILSRNALVESLESLLGELVPRMPQLEEARPTSRFSLWGMLSGRAREERSCR